ncbi:hypothetical protein BB558_007185, partial [Smittium angustum]
SDNGHSYWICTQQATCDARSVSIGDPQYILSTSIHAHLGNSKKVEAARIIMKIKEMALPNRHTPSLIIIREITIKPAKGPPMIRKINRIKSAASAQDPSDISELGTIESPYNIFKNDEGFLLTMAYQSTKIIG